MLVWFTSHVQFIGTLVHAELSSRWKLHRNLHRSTRRRLLPELLAKLSLVDVFIHDSLHTRRNILFELTLLARVSTIPLSFL